MQKRHRSRDRGAELIEMAIVTPAFLLIFAGIAESGLLFRSFEVMVNAAREGARLAVLPGNEQNDYETVWTRVNAYLLQANVTAPGDPLPPTIVITEEAIPIAPGVTANGVRVTIVDQYTTLFLGPVAAFFNQAIAGTITYQASALMRTQVAASGT